MPNKEWGIPIISCLLGAVVGGVIGFLGDDYLNRAKGARMSARNEERFIFTLGLRMSHIS